MSPRPETSGGPRSTQQPGAGVGSGAAPGRSPAEGEGSAETAPADADTQDRAETQTASEAIEEDLEAALSLARNERDEYLEMVRRVQADFENYKKRMLRQQTDLLERAAEGLVVRLLPALEAFDLARAHLGGAEDMSAEGKALLQASALMFDTLAKEGLERVDEPGVAFDPNVHEAVDHEASEPAEQEGGDATEGAEGTGVREDGPAGGPVVTAVLRAGYRWKGRVIRPAMVRVRG